MANTNTTTQQHWAELLKAAVEQPGLMLQAYSNFHGYSVGNQLAAILQCNLRGITPGPISTYVNWQKLGRHVKKGEKAIELCMPITYKKKSHTNDAPAEREEMRTLFVWKRNWFVLCQTEGDAVELQETPGWNKETALAGLQIREIEFEITNGNVQGYARNREIAISPLAEMPHKTTFHELAHVVLGHTTNEGVSDSDCTPKGLREAEAEAVALLCCESLGLPGADFCRGYIQNWLDGAEIPERSAQRIFKAADQILEAGQV